MKMVISFALFLMATCAFSQNYLISQRTTDSLFIGLNNSLQLIGYNRTDNITVSFPKSIRGRKIGRFNYNMTVSRPTSHQQIFILKDNIPVDSITVSIYKVTLKEFIVTKDRKLVKSGTYPLEMIQQINNITLILNIPPYRAEVLGYRIEIWNPNDILYYGRTQDGHFNHQNIREALIRLKRGGGVHISRVWAKFPWDDGAFPQTYKLIVK